MRASPSPLGRGGPQGRGGFRECSREEPTPPLTRHPSKEGMGRDTKRRQGVWPVPSGVSAG